MGKIRVLLVDGHTIMRDGLRAIFHALDDIEVVGEASDGKEALDRAQELDPDVVIMDVIMPRMDGIEATRHLCTNNPRTKVLILTQYEDSRYVLSAMKAGANAFVPKRALVSDVVTATRAVSKGDLFLYSSAASALIEDYRSQTAGKGPRDSLTPREQEVLKLTAEGYTSRDVAEYLHISLKTAISHRTRVMA